MVSECVTFFGPGIRPSCQKIMCPQDLNPQNNTEDILELKTIENPSRER